MGCGLGFGYVWCYGAAWVHGYCRFGGLGSKEVWGLGCLVPGRYGGRLGPFLRWGCIVGVSEIDG